MKPLHLGFHNYYYHINLIYPKTTIAHEKNTYTPIMLLVVA